MGRFHESANFAEVLVRTGDLNDGFRLSNFAGGTRRGPSSKRSDRDHHAIRSDLSVPRKSAEQLLERGALRSRSKGRVIPLVPQSRCVTAVVAGLVAAGL